MTICVGGGLHLGFLPEDDNLPPHFFIRGRSGMIEAQHGEIPLSLLRRDGAVTPGVRWN
jgi:hypothetical protein